jgi:hypothetical protein
MARVRYLAITDTDAQFRLAVATASGPAGPLVGGFLAVIDRLATSAA